jgi:hypothetical protein
MSTPPTSPRIEGVVLRTARADDDVDLIRLAELDGALPLAAPALIAEENGAIVAALCLSTGRAVADPFVPSLHVVERLRQHAARRRAPPVAPRGHRLLPPLALRASFALRRLGAPGGPRPVATLGVASGSVAVSGPGSGPAIGARLRIRREGSE